MTLWNRLHILVGFWMTSEQKCRKTDDDAVYGAFSFRERPYPPSEKVTRTLDICWEWNLPEETSWQRSWVVVP